MTMERWKISLWKIALGVAIVAAIAAPFAFGTWQPLPNAGDRASPRDAPT